MSDKARCELEKIECELRDLQTCITMEETEVTSLKRRHDVASMRACRQASRDPGGLPRAALTELAYIATWIKYAQSQLDDLNCQRRQLQERRREILAPRVAAVP